MGEGERFQLGTVGALSLSVVSSVSIVICNKALISSLGFTFGKCQILYFSFPLSIACVIGWMWSKYGVRSPTSGSGSEQWVSVRR
jgi:hypothetical protein